MKWFILLFILLVCSFIVTIKLHTNKTKMFSLSLLILFYFKILSILLCFFAIIIQLESRLLLKSENVSNVIFKPHLTHSVPKDTPFSLIFYSFYWNCVFDLSYLKILHGRFFWFYTISFTNVLKIFFFWFFGISRLLIKLLLLIWQKSKESDLKTFLFVLVHREFDSRILLKINNVWIANGFVDKISLTIEKGFGNTLSFQKRQYIIDAVMKTHKDVIKDLNNHNLIRPTFLGKSLDNFGKINPINHKLITNFGNASDAYLLETDWKKSELNNHYNKPIYINKYVGNKKFSQALEEKMINTISVKPFGKESVTCQILGFNQNFKDKIDLIDPSLHGICLQINSRRNELSSALEQEGINNFNFHAEVFFQHITTDLTNSLLNLN